MKLITRSIFIALALLLLYATGRALPSQARTDAPARLRSYLQAVETTKGDQQPAATRLTIDPPGQVQVGQPVTINAHFSAPSGEPDGTAGVVALDVFVDGVRDQRVRTDSNGVLAVRIKSDLQAGKHTVKVEYTGSKQWGPASATADLVVVPSVVEIHLVPPLPGVRFLLDGHEFDSDQKGVARIDVDRAGDHLLEIPPASAADSDRQITFNRWADDVFTPSRHIVVPLSGTLQVGFQVSYQVSQTFTDLDGRPVDASRISSLTLKSSQGTILKFQDGRPRWLQSNNIVRRTTGLEQAKVQYYVESVVISGANVVNQAQQRFLVSQNAVWPIKLLLYSAQFTARDALLGFPLSSSIRLDYADGHSDVLPLDSRGQLTVRGLPRGEYKVTVNGVQGIAPTTPISLSQDQQVSLQVVTQLDMAVAVLLLMLVAVGLLFVGRPHLRGIFQGAASVPTRLVTGLLTPLLATWGRLRQERPRSPLTAEAVAASPTARATFPSRDTSRSNGDSLVDLWLSVAEKSLRTGDYSEARTYINRVLDLDPRNEVAWQLRLQVPPAGGVPASRDHLAAISGAAPRPRFRFPMSGRLLSFALIVAVAMGLYIEFSGAYRFADLNSRNSDAPKSDKQNLPAEKVASPVLPSGLQEYGVSGVFLDFWGAHGGSAVFGRPISPEIVETGENGMPLQVQYFERARLEYHPENKGTPFEVMPGALGKEVPAQGSIAYPLPASLQGKQILFGQTGFSSPEKFVAFWLREGGVLVLGYPLTPVLLDTGPDGKQIPVQYFERARLEYHAEYAGTDNEVQLSPLGEQVFRSRYPGK